MISIIMPTRNRPVNLRRLFQSLIDTCDNVNNIEICLRIDNDDILTETATSEFSNLNIKITKGNRSVNNSNYWNDAWRSSTGDILMMCGDDFIFRTQDWDKVIEDTFNESNDKIMFVFGEDGIQHGNLGTHAFVHKNWCDVLGYFCIPIFNVYYYDTWNDELSKTIGRRVYLPNLYFEHAHHCVGKATYDENYQSCDSKNTYDQQIWDRTGGLRSLESKRLMDYIEGFNK